MKKNVVLADNSYTIRRIVELSFSDEEDIELISYENGQDISEKLLELKPAVVLVDIKLPEMNGYEVCKFINNNDELKNTKVFLIKGGFEPVDEDQLSGLKYEDFITKPFDSKALVITIKSILDEPGNGSDEDAIEEETIDIPSSMPEEISEINDIMDRPDEIDFSDVQSEMDASGITDTLNPVDAETSIRDEVLPSEEITQGSGMDDGEDRLSPETGEEFANPFKDDEAVADSEDISEEEAIVKENIKLQEEELEIGSLTMEEINIQKEIDRKKGIDSDDLQVSGDPVAPDFDSEQEIPESIEEIPGDEGQADDEKDQLDPSLSNMDSSDLDNVFSIEKTGSVQDELPAEEETPESDTRQETKQKSEEIKQVLEQLETDTAEKKAAEPVKETIAEKTVSPGIKETLTELTGLQGSNKIVQKVEEKLTVSVKEILWEIVPPLAEKIIKSEIDKLKAEIEKEYK